MYDAAKWACDRLGVDLCPGAAAPSSAASEASTAEDGLGAGATAVLAAAQRPDIVVVDARSNANLDAAASVARYAGLRDMFAYAQKNYRVRRKPRSHSVV